MKPRPAFFIIVLLVLLNAAFAQTDSLKADLLKDIPAWMAEYHVPCVGVGIIENGRIRWVKNFGELEAGRPAPKNTLFNIASQTKPATAMLTVKLEQTGVWVLAKPQAHT